MVDGSTLDKNLCLLSLAMHSGRANKFFDSIGGLNCSDFVSNKVFL